MKPFLSIVLALLSAVMLYIAMALGILYVEVDNGGNHEGLIVLFDKMPEFWAMLFLLFWAGFYLLYVDDRKKTE